MAKKFYKISFATLSKFTSKNAEILFVHYLFGRAFHCLIIITKNECKKTIYSS